MNKFLPIAVLLAGVAVAASGCSTAGPGSPASTPAASQASPSAAATGWESGPTKDSAARIKAAGLEVLSAEGAAEHFHAHLDVFVDGRPVAVPADIGFSFAPNGQPNGISALHTHDGSGVIHIEAAVAGATYTLGQLLTEWGVQDGTVQGSAAGWSVAVNGTRQDMPVRSVILKAHDEVVLYRGAAPSPLPAAFKFPAGE
ncbi:MAG TPA: hypothetical protein VF867_03010 [Arthrobacter sp.]